MGKVLVFLSFPVGLILGFWFWTNVFKVTKKVDKKVAENKMKKEAIIQAEKDKVNKIRNSNLNSNDDLIRF